MQITFKKIFIKSSFTQSSTLQFSFSSSIYQSNRCQKLPQFMKGFLCNRQQQFFSQQNNPLIEKQTKKQYAKKIAERDAFVGKWLKMKYIDFEISGKIIQNYEMIERTTKDQNDSLDGVASFAILKKENETSKLIIIANYRAPVDKYVLEIPAGFMDSSDIVQNAIRELKEETGYIAEQIQLKVSNIESPPTYTDPWRSRTCLKSVFLEVDGNKPENIDPKQSLEDSESIFAYLIDLDENIVDKLIILAEQHNYLISLNLWSFVQGIQFAKTFNI